MKNGLVGSGIFLAVMVAITAMAGIKGDTPEGHYGAVNVLQTATKVPTTCHNRNGWAAFNLGPNTIYCGFDNSVATTTGFPVLTNTPLSMDLVCAKGISANVDIWCIAATADQSSPANTRYIEAR